MKSDIKESVAGKFCVWLLLLGLMTGQAVAQQKVVVIQSELDVINGCVFMNVPGNKGQMLMGPLVPSGTPEKPDMYSMTYYVSGTNHLRNLVFTFDRSDKFVGYDEVALGDGRVLFNPPHTRFPAMGRFGENHILSMSDTTFAKVQKEGMTLKWRKKGKNSVSTTFEIPAYFFTGINKRVEKMLGTGVPVAKAESASPYIQSGSIGKKQSKEETKMMDNELSHLKGADLIGQIFIFMPQLPKNQLTAYTFGDDTPALRRLAYEKYVGKVVKIVSYNTDPAGKEHYGGQVEETGELIHMEGGTSGAKLMGLALKRDIDNAREKFIGKKVWLKEHTVYTYNEDTEEVVTHIKPRFTEFTVQNVVLGTLITPVRFILEDSGGDVYFVDVYMSRSNMTGGNSNLFDYHFYFKMNPREIFSDWSDEAFRLVSLDQVKQGMTKMHVRFALGVPESINTSELGDIKLEMWHYKSKVVTFNNGIISGIDTLK